MPTYAFACEKCGHEFEELVGMGKTAPCPKCASAKVKKLMTAPAGVSGGRAAASPAPMSGGGGKCNPGCGCH
jgi:putative FmdB family regulatory protein